MRGKFITLEGPEGSGKSTQAQRLCSRLEARGLEVVKAREPGGTATGELIREILQHNRAGEPLFPESEALLFAASRAQLVRSVIEPALERGAWVVCDRFADSTTAYQGYGRGFPVEDMIGINSFAVGASEPDVTLLLDLEVELGFDRMRQRNLKNGMGEDRFEREAIGFHEKVRRGYLALAERFPSRFRVIDASMDEDNVEVSVWDMVCETLGMEAD